MSTWNGRISARILSRCKGRFGMKEMKESGSKTSSYRTLRHSLCLAIVMSSCKTTSCYADRQVALLFPWTHVLSQSQGRAPNMRCQGKFMKEVLLPFRKRFPSNASLMHTMRDKHVNSHTSSLPLRQMDLSCSLFGRLHLLASPSSEYI